MRRAATGLAAALLLTACATPPRPASSAVEATSETTRSEMSMAMAADIPVTEAPPLAAATAQGKTHAEIHFAYRSTHVPKDALPLLNNLAQELKADRQRFVTLVAHTDSLGSGEFSVALADRRARAVATELLKLGARPAQIRKRAMGNAMAPRGGCVNESCYQKMRRVELHLSEPGRR